MNTTTLTYSSEHSWTGLSRRGSLESILSIQGRETDFVRDTSDTEDGGELEPFTESDSEPDAPVVDDSSEQSDNEIISTEVIEVSMRDDGDLELADSEQTDSDDIDSEIDLYDYWECAQCRVRNNNPIYRYCEKCFKVRKNFFPPRPKRKRKRTPKIDSETVPRTASSDSGVEFNSQELSQNSEGVFSQDYIVNSQSTATDTEPTKSDDIISNVCRNLKRRSESADRNNKRLRTDFSSDSDRDSDREVEVKPLTKTVSDPALTIDDTSDTVRRLTKRAIANSLKEKLDSNGDLCIVCCAEPKSGVFVHGRIAHICCCYKCAVKVWAKNKRCPVCNCKVSNVLKGVVM